MQSKNRSIEVQRQKMNLQNYSDAKQSILEPITGKVEAKLAAAIPAKLMMSIESSHNPSILDESFAFLASESIQLSPLAVHRNQLVDESIDARLS